MATPTPVDQTVQRDRLTPDQADTPGSPNTKDLAEEANTPSTGPDTPDVTAEISSLSISLPSSSPSSSPHISFTEDSPQEAYPYYGDSDYDSDSSDEEPVTSKRAETRSKSETEE